MPNTNRTRRQVCLLLTTVLCAPALAAGAEPGPRLTEASVRALMAEVIAASKARDVARIGALLASDCKVAFVGSDPAQPRLDEMTRDQYLARLTDGYSSLSTLRSYDYAASNLKVALSADARQALVDADVTETLSFNDHDVVTHSQEASVIELRDGRPLIVKVAGTVTGTTH
jgi:hypothetical protein